MKLRRATPDDAAAIARVHIDSWRAAYRGLVPGSCLQKLDHGGRAQRLRESLAEGKEEIYVAEQAREVIGFAALGPCRDPGVGKKATGEIRAIYVDPRHWRKGAGTVLCRHAEGTLRARGCVQVVLWVFEVNEGARRFYEAMGFRTDGSSKMLDPGAPLKAVRYRKALGGGDPLGEPTE